MLLCRAGLHAYPTLSIKGITVDGRQASFELRPYLDEGLPQNVLEGEPSASCMRPLGALCSATQRLAASPSCTSTDVHNGVANACIEACVALRIYRPLCAHGRYSSDCG